MTSGEKCLATFSCRYSWARKSEKRLFPWPKQPQYFFSDATCFFTNKVLLLARDSMGGGLTQGTDILTVPLDKIRTAEVSEEYLGIKVIHKLKICFKNDPAEGILEIPLLVDIQNVKLMVNIFQGFLNTC